MNIEEWLDISKSNLSDLLSQYCVVNKELLKLDEIEKWEYQDFINFVQQRIPSRLYKYFPNKFDNNNFNYSIDALKENSVYLSFPKVFDDIYDSDISISFEEFTHFRLLEYCQRTNIDVSESLSTDIIATRLLNKLKSCHPLINAFDSSNCSEIENLANELFCERMNIQSCTMESLCNVMKAEYKYCLEDLKNTFKTTCFATNPYSQLMWGGSYGNKHKGFCIEYTVSKDDKFKVIYENLFPLVYSKVRSRMEKEFINQIDTFPSVDNLKNIYIHGALRKSIDWSFQNEWRLLLVEGMPEMKDSKVDFFPISKVFIGCRMGEKERNEIINICEEKGIECVGVRKRQDIFEMEEFEIKHYYK